MLQLDPQQPKPFTLRKAVLRDLDRLCALEDTAFSGDRLSRRSLRDFIRSPNACLLVAEAAPRSWNDGGRASQLDFGFTRVEPDDKRRLVGYALVLFRDGTQVSRLYSVAVAAGARGKGIAKALVDAAEMAGKERDALELRLEVREDNDAAIRLYEKLGFRRFGRTEGYYEDGVAAIRCGKALTPEASTPRATPPYYAQTTDFTCGPCALMMGLAALGDPEPLDRPREFALWREATSIFLIAAPGGCEPYGLALAAARRGRRASIHASQKGPYFVEARKGEKRRDIMREAQRIFREEAQRLSIPQSFKGLSAEALAERLRNGAVAIVLVSSERTPHWIVAYGADSHYIFAHDPWLEPDRRKARRSEALAIPIPEFERISAWGRSRLRTTVLLER
ncbi:MAG: peptidase C39 family protein [Parvibaculaceae bacterium]